MTQFAAVDDLRDYLATLLADELGQFSNGLPRIWIKPPHPPSASEDSLECIIARSPQSQVRGSSADTKKDLRRWVFTLVNYADDTKLHDATEKIKASDRLVLATVPAYTPPSTQNYESIRFEVFDPVILTATQ